MALAFFNANALTLTVQPFYYYYYYYYFLYLNNSIVTSYNHLNNKELLKNIFHASSNSVNGYSSNNVNSHILGFFLVKRRFIKTN